MSQQLVAKTELVLKAQFRVDCRQNKMTDYANIDFEEINEATGKSGLLLF